MMCGRYTFTQFDGLAERFNLEGSNVELVARYNIAPSQNVPVIINLESNHLAMFRWGLIPHWAKDPSIGNKMINARAETLAEKASFKFLLQRKRCLVLADGFYEWQKEGTSKKPFRIALREGNVFAIAGLWDSWASPSGEVISSCTIITTEPNDLIKSIHNRMPAILPLDKEHIWLDRSITESEILRDLLRPYPNDLLMAYEVSSMVNSPKNDNPNCIVPATSAYTKGASPSGNFGTRRNRV